MIGMIVTGHGQFASGLVSSMMLLAGKPQCCRTVDYLSKDTPTEYNAKLNQAIEELKDCEGILILTDLSGGTPLKMTIEMKKERREAIEIVSGTNLGMLLEAAISRTLILNLRELSEHVVRTGKNEVRRIG